jgi:hypothetical protein
VDKQADVQARVVRLVCEATGTLEDVADGQADGQADGEADGQVDSQADGQADRPRAIVYCQTIQQVTTLAEAIGCSSYHGQIGSSAERSRIIRQWVEEGGAICATNALGVGVDIPDVRLVVHAGLPRSLRDLAQESGRGGRDGGVCRSIVVVPRRTASRTASRTARHTGRAAPVVVAPRRTAGVAASAVPEPVEGGAKEEDIREYVEDSIHCRRTILSRVLDGRTDRTQCEEGEAMCDLYQDLARTAAMASIAVATDASAAQREARLAVRAAHSQARHTGQQVEEFIRCLRVFKRNCIVCLELSSLSSSSSYEAHPLEEGLGCLGVSEEGGRAWEAISRCVRELELVVRGSGGFATYSGCFYCGVPQQCCGRWKPAPGMEGLFAEVPGRVCFYDGLLFQVVGYFLYRKQMEGACAEGIGIVRGLGV